MAALVGVALTWVVAGGRHVDTRQVVLVVVVPALLGFLLAGWPDLSARSVSRGLRYGFRGAAVGGVAGVVGFALADAANSRLSGAMNDSLALLVGWMIVAALIGCAIGLLFAPRKAIAGLIGGLVGGAIGGEILWLLGIDKYASFGQTLSAVAPAAALLGFSIGGAERLSRRNWLEVLDGPLAGKDFMLYNNEASAGRGATCEISLAADKRALDEHAVFSVEDDKIYVRPLDGTVEVDGNAIQMRTEGTDRTVKIGSTYLAARSRAR